MKNRHILIDFQHSFDFSCMDFENGVWLDTSVYLNGNYLITISGNDIDKFTKEFENLLTKFRI
jgi:hypothetical protein